MSLVLAVDLGSTHLKCALYDGALGLRAQAVRSLRLHVDGAQVESDPAEWWSALCEVIPQVLRSAGVSADAVSALTFCAQMQGVVLVDEALAPVRPCINYLDTRADQVFAEEMQSGWPKIEGANARRVLESVIRTNFAPGSSKDPLWKVRWLMRHEPQTMARARHWLDVKDWLVARCTGRACTTADSAHLSGLYTFAGAKSQFSEALCRLYRVDRALLPEVVRGDSVAGPLTPEAAAALGLNAGTPVVPGGGDISCVAFGAGAVSPGDLHIYLGTSGWVAQTTTRKLLDTKHFIAGLRTCLADQCLYMGELQTAGVCLSWVHQLLGGEGEADYGALSDQAAQSPPGAKGLLFAPWLHGSRSPNEDPHARGLFVNLGLSHRRPDVLRAVFEGVALHLAWILEALEKKAGSTDRLRFVGGGARSSLWAQTLADATGKTVEVPPDPQLCGVRGSALLALAATKPAAQLPDLARTLPSGKTFAPQSQHVPLYAQRRVQLRDVYRAHKPLFRATT
jgi:xylulokinase